MGCQEVMKFTRGIDNDMLNGSDGNDYLSGGDGSGTIDSGPGNDELHRDDGHRT